MNRSIPIALSILLCTAAPRALGQMSGSRGVIESGRAGIAGVPYLDRETVEGYITIEGRVERRVQPTEIRVVIAVTGEGATAQECRNTVQGTIDSLKQAWSKIGIPADRIVVDFIAVLPRYEWSIENRGQREVAIETRIFSRIRG